MQHAYKKLLFFISKENFAVMLGFTPERCCELRKVGEVPSSSSASVVGNLGNLMKSPACQLYTWCQGLKFSNQPSWNSFTSIAALLASNRWELTSDLGLVRVLSKFNESLVGMASYLLELYRYFLLLYYLPQITQGTWWYIASFPVKSQPPRSPGWFRDSLCRFF